MMNQKQECVAQVGGWEFVCAPKYQLNGGLSYDYFAIPGRKIVSKAELELWAATVLDQYVTYFPA